jgi:hypothetical protein
MDSGEIDCEVPPAAPVVDHDIGRPILGTLDACNFTRDLKSCPLAVFSKYMRHLVFPENAWVVESNNSVVELYINIPRKEKNDGKKLIHSPTWK